MVKVRLGTRASKLALHQARKVQTKLSESSIDSEIITIDSAGDIDLSSPLHKMNTVGVFTRALDNALLKREIDIAVHSCKDLPTVPTPGLELIAYLERGSHRDILVKKTDKDAVDQQVIATGSLRRKTQWKYRYPNYSFEGLRGNIQTRLKKLQESNWYGIIMAEAALHRLELHDYVTEPLDWMIPAPAQGVIGVVSRKDDNMNQELRAALNHKTSELCASVERQFLRILEGGCSAPIGAHMSIRDKSFHFRGILCDLEGSKSLLVEETIDPDSITGAAERLAQKVLDNGGKAIIAEIRKNV